MKRGKIGEGVVDGRGGGGDEWEGVEEEVKKVPQGMGGREEKAVL